LIGQYRRHAGAAGESPRRAEKRLWRAAQKLLRAAVDRLLPHRLSTPQPDFDFPGLRPGDRWCLCAQRWREAFEAGSAPRVILGATHEATLEIVALKDLKRHAIDLA
jgi:hypothetical protein